MKRKILPFLLSIVGITLSCHAQQNTERIQNALQYIERGQAPYDYIADKLRSHKVITLGEDHWIADHSQFLCDVLRNVGYTPDTRIVNLALEFGSERDQKLADSLAFNKVWDETLANKILLNAPDTYGNPFKGYRDILYTVWDTNRQKEPNLRTRILLVDPAEAPRWPESRDQNIAKILRFCIFANNKTIFYAGQAHSQYQTRGQLPSNGRYYYNYPSASKLIKVSYPDDIFSINLWGGYMGSYGYVPDDQTVWTLIDGGEIDQAFAINGNVPVGFDIDNGFPLTPSQLYAGKGSGREPWPKHSENGSPYTADLTLSDYCDGIIFIKPVDQFTGMQLIDIYDDEWISTRGREVNPPISSKEEIFKQIIDWHPTLLPLPSN